LGPEDKLYYTRLLAGFIVGVLEGFLGVSGIIGLIIALWAYIFTYYVARWILRIESLRECFIGGASAYFPLWLILWVLVFNLTQAPP